MKEIVEVHVSIRATRLWSVKRNKWLNDLKEKLEFASDDVF